MSRFGRRLLATWSAKGGRSSARPTASRGWRPSAVDRSTSSRSEEHTSELQSRSDLVCRLLLEKKKKINTSDIIPNQGAVLRYLYSDVGRVRGPGRFRHCAYRTLDLTLMHYDSKTPHLALPPSR